ncbi:hypothetical protein RRG08_001009 [Elysia crispata]|uniref:C-type lectin domain-containing protein n=1 Tax=Elysia crispata TaxID=231223 RepID=A0AAE1AVR9_9GAST|nr:hypothetical protein RRG08_001009 [Elysia crispata]
MAERPEDVTFGHTRADVNPGAFADNIQLDTFTPPGATGGGDNVNLFTGEAETPFIDPPEDVWEAQNATPPWAASSVPSGVSQEDLADAQHTKTLVDRWQGERGKVQQNLEFASSTKDDLWLRWGKQWLLLTYKNEPGVFLAPSTIKRYRVDVAKALGVYNSTNLSPQDDAVLEKTDQQVGEAVSAIETAPLEDLGQTPGTFVWSSGYPVLFAPWASGQPAKQTCVYMDIQGNFNSASCSQQRPFVCRSDDEPPQGRPNPPGGYCKDLRILGILSNYTESGSLCYYFVTHMLSHSDASYVCRVQGGNLASIHDLSQRSTGLASKAWIGMRKSPHGSYYWLDDSPVDFINWAPGYPKNKDPDDVCVFMATDGTWYNDFCSSRLPFLCAVSKVFPTQTLSLPAPEMTQESHNTCARDTDKNNQPLQTTRTLNTYTTSIFAAHVTLAPLETDPSSLTAGDKAAIGLGVIVVVLIAILAAFAFVRYRSSSGSFFRRSFLRRELSRAKNFENSLYEETRKDTLTSRERVETLTVETLSLDRPGSWPENRGGPVSINLNSQSGQEQSKRPGVELGHGELENHMDSPTGGLWMAPKGQEDKFLANGTHGTRDAIVIKNETAATLVNNIPDQMTSIVESQA